MKQTKQFAPNNFAVNNLFIYITDYNWRL